MTLDCQGGNGLFTLRFLNKMKLLINGMRGNSV